MRVRFLVDGFNLYHSIKKAEAQLGMPLRWLNLRALCQTLLQSTFGPGYTLEGVHYVSALATHLEQKRPDVVRRHRTVIAALESTGVEVMLATFKRKDRLKNLDEMRIQIRPFRRWFTLSTRAVRLSYRTHEEKQTDVAIACKLLELLCRGSCESAVLMTGDTDIAPAIRTAKALYPGVDVAVAFPFLRHSRELEGLATRHVKISAQLDRSHQFPAVLMTSKGTPIAKPPSW